MNESNRNHNDSENAAAVQRFEDRLLNAVLQAATENACPYCIVSVLLDVVNGLRLTPGFDQVAFLNHMVDNTATPNSIRH